MGYYIDGCEYGTCTHNVNGAWRGDVYDSTLALTKIRGLIDKIHAAIENENVNYFVTGQYANDSYQLTLLVQELDKFLTKNDDFNELPHWWQQIDPLSIA